MHHPVIERELELKLVLSPERSIPVPARLLYLTDDPYAVHITFHTGSSTPVNWTFARELLVEGVFRPCGHGDVRIWPTKVDNKSVLCMALSSPDGDALLEAPMRLRVGLAGAHPAHGPARHRGRAARPGRGPGRAAHPDPRR